MVNIHETYTSPVDPTVDGRNRAPVDVVNPIIYKVYVSQVVQDFFHQQYESCINKSSCQVAMIASSAAGRLPWRGAWGAKPRSHAKKFRETHKNMANSKSR